MRRLNLLAVIVALMVSTPGAGPLADQSALTSTAVDVVLLPTNHPRLPADPSLLWMVPENERRPRTTALNQLASAVKRTTEANYAKALPILNQLSNGALRPTPLGPHVEYYRGLAELRLGRAEDARRTFQALVAGGPAGFLNEGAALLEAEADEMLGEYAAAIAIYERLTNRRTTSPEEILMRLGRAARTAGDAEKAMTAFSRVFFEFPLSDLSPVASTELNQMPNYPPIEPGSNRYKLELGRAERLFGFRRYTQARVAFESVRAAARGDDRELVNLRLAECDYFLKRPRSTRDLTRPYVNKASRQGEALFFYAVAARELGDLNEYFRVVRRLADDFPDQSWSEEALNNLASYHIVQDADARADETLREMYGKFPSGRYAERAAWKIGWWAYRNGRYGDTARVFAAAAVRFPRADYRPAWLYWSGRAHDVLKDTSLADARYALVATDYLNSYYGRLAVKQLDGRVPQRRLIAQDEATPTPALPPNDDVVRALLGLELYDAAVDELEYAQKTWGDSPAIQATLAWIYRQQGRVEAGSRQFTLYRAAVNTMRRTYPQFMTAGGEDLPREVLTIIFPLEYWDLIGKHSAQRNLDPYLVAALIAQESTFVRDIRSAASAYGLMQLLPSTARQYARRLKLRYAASLLTSPEANIRLGTAYLADKIREFGELHLALASYNAGERAVRRWVAERPGVEREEFIDDIPYPETQNYVKRILGTAEDYRRLYGAETKRATN